MSALLEVDDLWIRYRSGSFLTNRRKEPSVRGVCFDVAAGETFGLVGESGSGKSSVGKAILRLVQPERGVVRYDGQDVRSLRGRSLLEYRSQVQVVFQDPWSSLNPRATVGRALLEPLRRHRRVRRSAEGGRVAELLELVGLPPAHADRLPAQLSGGQRQRVAIARALAVEPRLIVCDEPVSALDVSTQSQIANLLQDLQAELGLAYLFIAHDLAVVHHLSHRIGVMSAGGLVECGPADEVYRRPQHAYTRRLLDAEPVPDPAVQRRRREERRLRAG
ncbi:ABC transporter ATP-binding protein [Nocardioides silvaticus]|uniref:ABC transporter ATP-binding protein n=1 Tax=Nocardioides silvaticus TaxID=2201891 RepID=A0A316TEL9_9ACTN|nr:ATP-binding cassette domain-containing protein [Nocardioides silvaticus]PWN02943.1 ABC transporter ATP-binding protein [Nocardioides silvaticus]